MVSGADLKIEAANFSSAKIAKITTEGDSV
jgi:hypothetical protein